MKFDRNASSGYMTNWAARLFAKAIDTRLKPIGLSSGYMPVIFALANGAELSQRALTEQAAIEQPTMAATLSRMERDGLVVRRADPEDRRSALFRLSPLGLEKTAKVKEAGRDVNAVAMAGLTEPERNAYVAALGTIVRNLEASLDAPD